LINKLIVHAKYSLQIIAQQAYCSRKKSDYETIILSYQPVKACCIFMVSEYLVTIGR